MTDIFLRAPPGRARLTRRCGSVSRSVVQRWLELAGGGPRSGWARGWPSAARGRRPGPGPFPQGGLIPVLRPPCNYDRVVGFVVALVLYWGLTMVSVGRQPTGSASYAGQQG